MSLFVKLNDFLTNANTINAFFEIFEFLMWTLIAVVIFKLGKFYAYGYGRYISHCIDSHSDSDDNIDVDSHSE